MGATGSRRGLRRTLSRALTIAVVCGVAAWTAFLRPTFLGGDTTYAIVSGTSMQPTLHGGDLVVARRAGSYEKGDILVYAVRPEGAATDKLIVHRIVGGSAEEGFVLRGDNRDRADVWHPRPGDVRGAVVTRIPALGRVLARLQQPRLLTAGIAGTLVFLLVVALSGETLGRRRPRAGEHAADGLGPGARTAPLPPSGHDPVPPAPARAPGYLVLARSGDAYALVEREGEAPGKGSLLVLDGRLFEVSGAALSPLPSDRRLCLVADRLRKT